MLNRNKVQHLGIVDPQASESLIAVGSWGPSLGLPKTADFGVSVVPKWRGKGLTLALLDHACTKAVQAGMETMRVDYRPDNSPVRTLLQSVALVLPVGQGQASAKASLGPYAIEVRKVVESVAAFLDAVGMGPSGEAKL
ncbi:N-acetyltransferase family protein [Hydrogenophaga sp.]|uniref:GNAT family N-acetyltransferase n=1 Tax=Hydrogenophaga sp. TaxID=1904254 RepID=UPI0035B1DA87